MENVWTTKTEKDESAEQAEETSGRKQANETSREEPIGVPHIIVENVNKSDLDEIYKNAKFPPIGEVKQKKLEINQLIYMAMML